MDDLDWLQVLALMILSGFISCLLMTGLQRVSRARLPPRLTTACAELRVSPDGCVVANEQARSLLGISDGGALDRDAVLARITKGRDVFQSGLENLSPMVPNIRRLLKPAKGGCWMLPARFPVWMCLLS